MYQAAQSQTPPGTDDVKEGETNTSDEKQEAEVEDADFEVVEEK